MSYSASKTRLKIRNLKEPIMFNSQKDLSQYKMLDSKDEFREDHHLT